MAEPGPSDQYQTSPSWDDILAGIEALRDMLIERVAWEQAQEHEPVFNPLTDTPVVNYWGPGASGGE